MPEHSNRRQAILEEMGLHPIWCLRHAAGRSVTPSVALVTVDQQLADLEAKVIQKSPVQKIVTVEVLTPSAEPAPDNPWQALRRNVVSCQACHLHTARQYVHWGLGESSAQWLCIAERPAPEDEQYGELLAGPVRRFFEQMLSSIHMQLSTDVFVTAMVKCHDPQQSLLTESSIDCCAGYYVQQIAIIQPKLIIAWGESVARQLLSIPLGEPVLRFHAYQYQNTLLLVMDHPAQLLMDPKRKAQAWQELCFAVSQTLRP